VDDAEPMWIEHFGGLGFRIMVAVTESAVPLAGRNMPPDLRRAQTWTIGGSPTLGHAELSAACAGADCG